MAAATSIQVLVIEDDADTRANLCDILELDQHRVDTAGTVAEALDRKNWTEYSAILVDRQLPDGTAEQLVPRLHELAPAAAILIVTGYADLDGAIAAVRQGAADYILKPINANALRASLARVAEKLRLAQERKHFEEKALQNERLAAIGQVVTGLAHESRNALQLIQASLDMLVPEVEDRPEALELVASIQGAEDRLHRLFENIRGYAAPLTLEPEPYNVAKIWRNVWEHLALLRARRQAQLQEEITGIDLDCSVDLFALERVFRNVFENSLAACRDPVGIEIHCSEARLRGAPALRISVKDNGPGLSAEQKQKIFQPFFTTKRQGTGLGMAIAKRIVEAHGGEIAVGNGTPTGAEIVILLPRGNA
jgi:signal transduction histidine kinase